MKFGEQKLTGPWECPPGDGGRGSGVPLAPAGRGI